ncbi:hypothetical protein F5146DRAFT_1002356 [Armillaria mellea]|nr:hypothetical protein F5146DRAFT_1002356 [Armillaria mellea]
MQGHGHYDDEDVPLAAPYSHSVASQHGRKADEENVNDSQAGITMSGGKGRSRCGGRGPSGLGPTIEEHATIMRAYHVQVPPLPPYRPPKPTHEIPPLLVEVLTAILLLIPCTLVPALTLLSLDFLSAAQVVLYGDLDILWHPDTLWIFTVTRRDLTSLAHPARPYMALRPDPRISHSPRARMDNLHLFPILLDNYDGDGDASPPTPLLATPTRTRLLSAPTPPSKPFLFPMPPLSPLPATPTPTQDSFAHTAATLLPNLMTLYATPRFIILLAPSCPLIEATITISTLTYCHPRISPSLCKRTEEKTLRSAIVVCPAIGELEIECDAGEERWCSIVPHFKSLHTLVMRKPGTTQVKMAKEELNDRFPLPKHARTRSTSSTISHSGHSMVISERARAARLATTCPALQHVVFPNGVQWHRPSPSVPPPPHSRSSPCLPFDGLSVKKIDHDVAPPPVPPKIVPLTGQRFMKREECFDLDDSDDDSLFYRPSPSGERSSIQRCHEQVEVQVQGAGKMIIRPDPVSMSLLAQAKAFKVSYTYPLTYSRGPERSLVNNNESHTGTILPDAWLLILATVTRNSRAVSNFLWFPHYENHRRTKSVPVSRTSPPRSSSCKDIFARIIAAMPSFWHPAGNFKQRFMKAEQCFDLNDSEDDNSLFFKTESEIRGAIRIVIALV